MLLFIAGFVLSLFGSLPPGLISLTVAQTAILRGLAAAMAVALGAAIAEFFQAWAAVLFSDWFLSHPDADAAFRWAAVPVFLGLGLYLLFWAKAPRITDRAATVPLGRQFVKGLVVSAFNLLAVPYWFVYCGWLRVEGWWKEGLPYTLMFAAGVTTGTVFCLGLYAWLGQMAVRRSDAVARYANRAIGLIFLGLAAKLLWELLLPA